MNQLLINDQPTDTYIDDTHVYNDITVFEQPTEKPKHSSPFTADW